MKPKIGTLVLAVICQLSTIHIAFAGRADVGTSGAVFLKLNAGSRPVAMGEAFAGVADDVNALYFNPAGTAGLNKVEFTAQYGSWFQSISYNALGFVYPVKDIGSFGIGIINLGVDNIEKRASDTTDPDSTFGAADYAYILHYSHAVADTVSAGINAKIITQKIDDKSATAFAGDAGVLWRTPVKHLSMGVAVQNIGNEIKFDQEGDPLPLNIKVGFGYQVALDAAGSLTLALDGNLPRDNDPMYCAGVEYQRAFSKEFSAALRGGYKTVSEEKLGGMSGLTAGAGLAWRQFGLDFAWVPYGDLGDTFRYSLVVKF